MKGADAEEKVVYNLIEQAGTVGKDIFFSLGHVALGLLKGLKCFKKLTFFLVCQGFGLETFGRTPI